MSFFEDDEKKALVKIQLIDKDTNEVRELGFAAKLRRQEHQDQYLVTSSSIFPEDIEEHVSEIVVDRYRSGSKNPRFKVERQILPVKVKKIVHRFKNMDVSVIVFEGGDQKEFLDIAALNPVNHDEKQRLQELSAYVFEGKEIIELKFKNQGGSYKLIEISKKGFDVKRAKGAPVICQGFRKNFGGRNEVVGVLASNSNPDGGDQVYPVLFTDSKRGPDERPTSSGHVTEASPSQSNNRLSDSKKLKSSIKIQTDLQPKLMASNDNTSAKTDDVFTNLTVYYDRKPLKGEQAQDLSRRERFQEYNRRSGTKVKKWKDIFIDTQSNPTFILVTGKPGIGKSLFCQMLIRDWALDRLFDKKENKEIPDIQFAYLLTFRQLCLVGEKKLNLREVLNCSTLLDKHSNIDDSLFKYLIENPSKVLIILDGYDEYSKQHREEIAGNFELKYPNDPKEKIPVPALCSKLIKGKILRDSVVLVSSRPGEADAIKPKTMGRKKINFDRYVEITGFSSQQVTEFVENYFSKTEKEETKNTVLEHIERNENLVSFCHIPLSCFLLCWCLEWRITHSGNKQNLPVTLTELYDEVVKVFVQILHSNLKYTELSENTKRKAQETLDKLAELAINLQKQSKYIFDEEDMKKLNLSEDEIENLKVSGILHCIPGIRISAFETKTEFTFTHVTLQEYLSAVLFVKNKEIPVKRNANDMTMTFMSGLLSGKKDTKLIKKLLESMKPEDEDDNTNKLLTLQCLLEYNDNALSKLTINNMHDKYCNSFGVIVFVHVNNIDCLSIAYLLNIVTLLHREQTNTHLTSSAQSFIVNTLSISWSSLPPSGVKLICESLLHSNITTLYLCDCNLDDKSVEIICDLLNTTLTHLGLYSNNITDEGAESICKAMTQPDSKLEWLDLRLNKKITDECEEYIRNIVEQHKHVILYIGGTFRHRMETDSRLKAEGKEKISEHITHHSDFAESTSTLPQAFEDKMDKADRQEEEENKHEHDQPEFIARGPGADEAYRQALDEGEVQVYQMEQDRAGKTSLKKSLLGLSFDLEEPSTMEEDVDPSNFCFDIDNVTDWQILKDNPKNDFDDSIASIMAKKLNESRDAPEPDSALEQPMAMPQEQVNNRQLDDSREEQEQSMAESSTSEALLQQEDNSSDNVIDIGSQNEDHEVGKTTPFPKNVARSETPETDSALGLPMAMSQEQVNNRQLDDSREEQEQSMAETSTSEALLQQEDNSSDNVIDIGNQNEDHEVGKTTPLPKNVARSETPETDSTLGQPMAMPQEVHNRQLDDSREEQEQSMAESSTSEASVQQEDNSSDNVIDIGSQNEDHEVGKTTPFPKNVARSETPETDSALGLPMAMSQEQVNNRQLDDSREEQEQSMAETSTSEALLQQEDNSSDNVIDIGNQNEDHEVGKTTPLPKNVARSETPETDSTLGQPMAMPQEVHNRQLDDSREEQEQSMAESSTSEASVQQEDNSSDNVIDIGNKNEDDKVGKTTPLPKNVARSETPEPDSVLGQPMAMPQEVHNRQLDDSREEQEQSMAETSTSEASEQQEDNSSDNVIDIGNQNEDDKVGKTTPLPKNVARSETPEPDSVLGQPMAMPQEVHNRQLDDSLEEQEQSMAETSTSEASVQQEDNSSDNVIDIGNQNEDDEVGKTTPLPKNVARSETPETDSALGQPMAMSQEVYNWHGLQLDDNEQQGLLVPPEIIARGPKAEEAYRHALEEGEVQVYRGRIMLIGQDRAGKTSLKKSLLGLSFDPEEPSTIGVDVGPSSFCVDVDNVIDWQTLKDNPKNDFYDSIASIMAEELNESRREAEEPDSAVGQPMAMPQEQVNNRQLDDSREEQEQSMAETSTSEALLRQEDNSSDNVIDIGNQNKDDENGKTTPLPKNVARSEVVPETITENLSKRLEAKRLGESLSDQDSREEQEQSMKETSMSEALLKQEDNSSDNVIDIGNQNKNDEVGKTTPLPKKVARSEVVPETVIENLIKRLKAKRLGESLPDQEVTVSIWDFAGQHLYYASHPVFFSPRAVYVLVYNLNKDLKVKAEPCVKQGVYDKKLDNHDKQTNLEAILSWLVSIHSARPKDDGRNTDKKGLPYIRPPVIFVGTHADCPFEEPTKMETIIKKSIHGKTYNKHVVRPFITVNNKQSSDDDGVQKVRDKVKELFGTEPYMGEKVPVRWFKFEQVVRSLVEAEKKNHLLLKDLEKVILDVCHIKDRNETTAMLDFYHDLGVIVKHGNTVVLQAEWLIDLFRKLITIRPYDDQIPLHSDYWSTLENTGILHMGLVDHVFKEIIENGEAKEDILAMMERYGLIARFGRAEDSENLHYFVPAQLKSSPEGVLHVEPSTGDPCTLYLHFLDGFIPHGLYNCLVSKLIAWCSKKRYTHEPKLYRSVSQFFIGCTYQYELLLICRKRFVKVVLRSRQSEQSERSLVFQPAYSVRRFLEKCLKEITDQCHWYRSLRYETSVLCPPCSGTKNKCQKHELQSCRDDDCLHLLPLLTKNPRPEVPGLEEWYRKNQSEESTTVNSSDDETEASPTQPTEESTTVNSSDDETEASPTQPTEESTTVNSSGDETETSPTQPTEESTTVNSSGDETETSPTQPTGCFPCSNQGNTEGKLLCSLF